MLVRLAIILLCISVLSNGIPQSSRPKLGSRIVGGENVTIGDYYYQVSVLFRGSHICGGTLVAQKQYVVTAAQCTDGVSVTALSVRAGTDVLNFGGDMKPVQTIHQHPKFSVWTYDYDIAILKLTSSFAEDNDNIKDAALPSAKTVVNDGFQLVATGWGSTEEGGILSVALQSIILLPVSIADCEVALGKGMITEQMMCAMAKGKDTCQGDTGGPLIVNETVLGGITSWGFGCARPGYPGVYTDVLSTNIRQYIKNIVGL